MNKQELFHRINDFRFTSRQLSACASGSEVIRHIVFGVDKQYLPHAWVTLLSVLRRNHETSWHFHFITADDLDASFASLGAFINGVECAITLHRVELETLSTLPACPTFPPSIYLRLLAPHVLGGVRQALYLDADIVCLRPLGPVWGALEEDGAIAAAVADGPAAAKARIAALGMHMDRYFNSGVLLIDLERWRAHCITEQVLACIADRAQQLKYPDQDALNLVLQGKVKYLAPQFNYQLQLGNKPAAPPEHTVFLHYTGVDKPWQAWNGQPEAAYYRDIRSLTPWAGVPYDAPVTQRHFKRMYKLRWRQRKYMAGLLWMFKCLALRIRNKVVAQ